MTSDERIERLEAQIEKLQMKQAELHKQLTEAQIDQWQGRLDDLEVQLHLGSMEANDRVAAVMDQLRGRWNDARRQLEDAAATATSVAETLRDGLQDAFRDVRNAVLESKRRVTS